MAGWWGCKRFVAVGWGSKSWYW